MTLEDMYRRLTIGPSPTDTGSSGGTGRSLLVTTALTPDSFNALLTSMDFIRAWA